MIFFKVGIFLLLVHGTVCCERNLDCEGCLQKSCRFIVTTDREKVCVGKNDTVSVLKEMKKARFCKYAHLYLKESDSAPAAPNDVKLNKEIHEAKTKDVTRGTTQSPVESPLDLPPTTEESQVATTLQAVIGDSVPQIDRTGDTDAHLNRAIHVAKMKDITRMTTLPSVEYSTEMTTNPPTTLAGESSSEPTTVSAAITFSTMDYSTESPTIPSTTPDEETLFSSTVTPLPPMEYSTESITIPSTITVEVTLPLNEITTSNTVMPPVDRATEITTVSSTPPTDDTINSFTTKSTFTIVSTSELPIFRTPEITEANDITSPNALAFESVTTEGTLSTSTVEMADEPKTNAATERTTTQTPSSKVPKNIQEEYEPSICKSYDNQTSKLLDKGEVSLRDSDEILSDNEEILMSFRLNFKCKQENRNDSLAFAYVSSLCSIAKLSEKIGIEKFVDRDQGWFLLNRARRFDATCSAVRYIRTKCKTSSPSRTRVVQNGLINGPRSPLFSRIRTSSTCDKNASKEDILSRLGRIMCLSGELFLELYRLVELNSYDVSFGLGNPSFRHPSTCISLFFKRRHCFNRKQ